MKDGFKKTLPAEAYKSHGLKSVVFIEAVNVLSEPKQIKSFNTQKTAAANAKVFKGATW